MKEWTVVMDQKKRVKLPDEMIKQEQLKPFDKVKLKIEKHKVEVKKVIDKKKEEALIKEYFQKYGKHHREVAEEWKYVSIEADRELDD